MTKKLSNGAPLVLAMIFEAVVLVMAAFLMLSSPSGQPQPGTTTNPWVIILALSTTLIIGQITLGLFFMYRVMGREVIEVTPTSLLYELIIPVRSSRKEYDTLILSDVQALSSPLSNNKRAASAIQFKYAGKPRTVGRYLSYQEAVAVIEHIRDAVPEFGQAAT